MRYGLTALLLLIAAPAWAAAPVLYFSDLVNGPKTGIGDGLGSGAIVTIWGVGLGSSQGGSKVYVGDVEAAYVYYWRNATGELPGGPANLYESHGMQEIAFSVPATAADGANTIKVTVGGVDSNTLAFTVRSGSIYHIDPDGPDTPGSGTFASPWQSPASFVTNAVAGDTGYFYTADYSGRYGYDVSANFELRHHHGTAGNPISYIAYPNQRPHFSGQTQVFKEQHDGIDGGHHVASKLDATPNGQFFFNFQGLYDHALAEPDWRLIGNKAYGVLDVGATGIFKIAGNTNICLGNEITGNAAPTNKNLAHSFYPSNGLDDSEIGWNYMHDNDWDSSGGYEVSVHTDGIVITGVDSVDTINLLIHDNVIIEGSTGSIRGIGVSRVGENSTVYIYNNVIKSSHWSTLWLQMGAVYVYNNTLDGSSLVSGDRVIVLGNTQTVNEVPLEGEVRNNIMIAATGISYWYESHADNYEQLSAISNNLYYGNGNGPAEDSNEVNADPLFTGAGVYTLQASSPAIGAGYNIGSPVINDIIGVTRGSVVDIGAYEYAAGSYLGFTLGTGGSMSLGSSGGTITLQ